MRLGRPSTTGRGGMESKIGAAELAAAGGVPAWIASPADLPELLAGRDAGTFFAAGDRGEPAFKLWLRHGKRMVGAVRIDEGAARAITTGNASLLAVGVTAVSSAFRVGDGVEIVDAAGRVIARGIAGVDSDALEQAPDGRRGRAPRPPGRPLDVARAASARGARARAAIHPHIAGRPVGLAERSSQARRPGRSSPSARSHAVQRTRSQACVPWRRPEGGSRCAGPAASGDGAKRQPVVVVQFSDDVGVRLATSPGTARPGSPPKPKPAPRRQGRASRQAKASCGPVVPPRSEVPRPTRQEPPVEALPHS